MCLFWHSSCGLLHPFVFTPCLSCSEHSVCPCTTLMKRVKSMHDLAHRTLQECNVALSPLRSLPCSQQQCHAVCESSSCQVLLLTLPLQTSSVISCHTLPRWRCHCLHSLVRLLSSMHAPPHAALWLVYASSAKHYIPMHDLAQRILKLIILNTTCEIHARSCAANSSSV